MLQKMEDREWKTNDSILEDFKARGKKLCWGRIAWISRVLGSSSSIYSHEFLTFAATQLSLALSSPTKWYAHAFIISTVHLLYFVGTNINKIVDVDLLVVKFIIH